MFVHRYNVSLSCKHVFGSRFVDWILFIKQLVGKGKKKKEIKKIQLVTVALWELTPVKLSELLRE